MPNSPHDANRASGEDTTHDKISKCFVESGFAKIVTFIASSEDCLDYRGHVLEIIGQVLREQDPKSLALANSVRVSVIIYTIFFGESNSS